MSRLLSLFCIIMLVLSITGVLTTNDAHPLQALSVTSVQPLQNIKQVVAGSYHTCALTTVGGVKCWGYNISGQIDDDTKINKYAPVDIAGLSSGVAALTAGSSHTCALTDLGGVKCWGRNGGQLGNGTESNDIALVDVLGLSSGVKAVFAGSGHTCALTIEGGANAGEIIPTATWAMAQQ